MKKVLFLILVFTVLVNLCACAKKDVQPTQPTQNTDPTQSTTETGSATPKPEYIIGGTVRESFLNWEYPAIFYGYNTETYKELLIITENPLGPDEMYTRIACLEVQFHGLQGFEYALSHPFSGKVLAYQVIGQKDSMFLHNAGKVPEGWEWEYNEGELIDLSNKGTNPSVIQRYYGCMLHETPTFWEHMICNELPSGSYVVLKGNMASKESEGLQDTRAAYDRVLNENGLGDILATLES